MATRMKDIADDLGLSVVTVSKVLRNHPDIGEETRERVLRRVKELDYQPNVLAQSLVTGRSYLIGLVVPDLIHPFFAEVAKALSTAIRPGGYSLLVTSSEEDPELEQREIRHLLARRLDALVIASTGLSTTLFEQMERQEQPFVLIDRALPGLSANFVGIDDVLAGRLATEHLLAAGCRRIAHIRGRDNTTGAGRHQGYADALAARGVPYDEELVITRSNVDAQSQEQGAEAMRLLLARSPRPDGVFCYNDPLAIGAFSTLFDAGLRIPEDVAVIGCGNLHYDAFLRVPLSSIDQHSGEIGRAAGETVLQLLQSKDKADKVDKTGRPAQPSSRIITPALIARASTARPRP